MENPTRVAGQNASSKEIKNCPLAQYHPDLWGDHFLNYTPPPQVIRMDPLWGGARNYSFESTSENMEKIFIFLIDKESYSRKVIQYLH